MNIADLKHIFQSQIDEGTKELYFMLRDGDSLPVIMRHPANKMEELVPLLSACLYAGAEARIPRFTKGEL